MTADLLRLQAVTYGRLLTSQNGVCTGVTVTDYGTAADRFNAGELQRGEGRHLWALDANRQRMGAGSTRYR